MSFEDALRLAQENGYAEKDPTADIEGIDACRKICILASLALVSMCIRMAFIRKALPKSICGMWNIFALGAA